MTINTFAAYIEAVEEWASAAELILDRFHVQRLALDALDETRCYEVEGPRLVKSSALKGTRVTTQMNPWNLFKAHR